MTYIVFLKYSTFNNIGKNFVHEVNQYLTIGLSSFWWIEYATVFEVALYLFRIPREDV